MIAGLGTRVAIRARVLDPDERADALPQDTAQLPYEVVVRGLLTQAAEVGGVATVKTATGRLVSGVVEEIEPADEHGFGRPVAALVATNNAITELRRRLDG